MGKDHATVGKVCQLSLSCGGDTIVARVVEYRPDSPMCFITENGDAFDEAVIDEHTEEG